MEEFLQKLARKSELLTEILTLLRSQQALIEAEDTDELLTSIAKRQKLNDSLDEIQAELPDRETMRANPRCLELITATNATLKAIEEQDAKNERIGVERMDAMRAELRRVNEGRKTYDSYEATGSNQIGGIYINKKK
ncbi:hypothetical protein FACS1894217_15010 [Clostridia bacterium]|nr:hypothetical protein FACS1894217_15010 [Clostridia bacterium]